MVAVSAEGLVDGSAPRAGLTITGLGVGDSLVSIWRTADDERTPVRGYRRVLLNDAAYVTDYDAPLGRAITYEVEVISGPGGVARATSTPAVIDVDEGWIMDPLMPASAVSITRPNKAAGRPTFAVSAMASLERSADVQLFKIMGSNEPMALFGQRMKAAGVDLSMIVDLAEENSRLRKLFNSTAQLSVRLPASWQESLPGTCFMAVAKVAENPVEHGEEGALTVWNLSGDTVAAPTIRVLTATFTYGDVAILFGTWGDKQAAVVAAAAAAGESPTYLFDVKHPLG